MAMDHGIMDVHWWAKSIFSGNGPLHAEWFLVVVWLEGLITSLLAPYVNSTPTLAIRSSLPSYILQEPLNAR